MWEFLANPSFAESFASGDLSQKLFFLNLKENFFLQNKQS
jgi:hypothetical protein